MGNPSRWHRFMVWFWRGLARRLPKNLVYFVLLWVSDVVERDGEAVTLDVAVSRWYVLYMQKREVF